MNYKKVIEKQISELQEKQTNASISESCIISKTIADLSVIASKLHYKLSLNSKLY